MSINPHPGFNPKTRIFTSTDSPTDIPIPANLTVTQFLFHYNPPPPCAARPPPSLNSKAPALIDSASPEEGGTGRKYTWSDVFERTEGIAKALKGEFGIEHVDGMDQKERLVGIYCENAIDYGPICWGAFRTGGIISPANPNYTSSELSYQLKLVTTHHPLACLLISPNPHSLKTAIEALKFINEPLSKIVLVRGSSKDGFMSLNDLVRKWWDAPTVPEIKWREGESKWRTAFLSFSSGTTGLPKAVNIPHYSVISNVLQIGKFTEPDLGFKGPEAIAAKMKRPLSPPVALGVLPPYHIYALIVVLHVNFFRGIPIVIIPKFSLEGMLSVIAKYKITELFIVPPQAVLMAKSPVVEKYDLSHARTAVIAGAPLTAEIANQFHHRFPHVKSGQAYGMTETGAVVSYPSRTNPLLASGGRLITNIKCKVVDHLTGNLKEPAPMDKKGEETEPYRGEIWTWSLSNALEYLGNEKATKETFDGEGYVHTGDEGFFGEDGNLYITDRIKELIKAKGNQVAPAELEGHILGHEDVIDVAVIGVHDDFSGEVPRAYVVLTPDAQKRAISSPSQTTILKKSIQEFVEDHKIRYKWLDGGVVFIDAVPKNPSGKILRRELRALAKRESEQSGKAKL